MSKLKEFDLKLLSELMKDSKRSDRQLAKFLGVSQPTVTRRRKMLEKNFLDGYTTIPTWGKVGFEIVAFNLLRTKINQLELKEQKEAVLKARKWFGKQPNVVLAVAGEGMGSDVICVSFHTSFSEFAEFKRKSLSELSDIVIECQSFLADVNPGLILKPFHLKYLAQVK